MEPEQPPKKKSESAGEYDLAPAAPTPPPAPPVESAADPRLDMAEPVPVATPAEVVSAAADLGALRPDLETGKARTIRIDMPCARCGQNLKDQPRVGECPACGFDIELSMQGDRLDFAEPWWVVDLHRGARLVFLAALIFIAACVARIFFGYVAIGAMMLAVGAILEFMGLRGITTRQPLPRAKKSPHTLAPLVRMLAAITMAGAVLVAMLCFWSGAPAWLFNTACICTLLALAARAIPQGYYFQQINQRIPNDSAAGEWMILGWILAGGAVFVALVYVPSAAYFSEQFGMFHLIPVVFGLVLSAWNLKVTRTLSSDLAASAYTAVTPRKQKKA